MHSLPELWYEGTYLDCHSADCKDTLTTSYLSPLFLVYQHSWCFICCHVLPFSTLLHSGSFKLLPNFTLSSLPHCFHPGKTHPVNWQGGISPAPLYLQVLLYQTSLSNILLFLPSALLFTVIEPPAHNTSFCISTYLLPQPLLLLLCQLALWASPFHQSLWRLLLSCQAHYLEDIINSLKLSSSCNPDPSRFLVSLTMSPSLWIRGKLSPVHLQNSCTYSLPPLIHPQSQVPVATLKIQPVPCAFSSILLLPLQRNLLQTFTKLCHC